MGEVMSAKNYTVDEFCFPIAQYGPGLVNSSLINFDLFSHPTFKKEVVASIEYNVPVISETIDLGFFLEHIELNSTDKLRSFTLDEVYNDFSENSTVIGYVIGILPWQEFFKQLLPPEINGIVVTVTSDCGSDFTYIANGGKDDWSSNGDHHDEKYNDMNITTKFFWKEHPRGKSRHCHFDLIIYPSDEFKAVYTTNNPILYAGLVGIVFVFTTFVFWVFSMWVHRRQSKIEEQAARAVSTVNSVFPKEIGDRLIGNREDENGMSHGPGQQQTLADLFPDSTVSKS